VINVENLDRDIQLLLSRDEVVSLNEKSVVDNKTEEGVDVVDLSTPNFANTFEARLNAAIMGARNLVAILAGENLARSFITEDLFDFVDSLAVLAVGDVISERRSNGATTTYRHVLSITMRMPRARRKKTLTALDIGVDVNTVVTFFAVGDTAHGLASRASRIITPLLGETLRATSLREAPTNPIALAVRWLADTVGRVLARRWTVAFLAGKVARVVDATEGMSMARVATLLLALLVLDL